VDVWLWAVRLYKSRSAATAACRGGHVRVNRAAAKASTHVKVGDRVEAFAERPRIFEKRQPRMPAREPGAGRPTKRERRELDRFRRP
jgi:ribosome-associated heat shock protein Hsp15